MHRLYVSIAQKIQNRFHIDARYFLSGGFWLVVAQATTIIGSLITTVFFTRLLSENDFGIYRYIIGIGVLLSSLSLTGIGPAIMQATAKGYRDFLRASTPITLRYGLPITATAIAGTGYYFYQDNLILSIGCLLIALLQPVQQFFLSILAFLHGQAKFKIAAQAQTYKAIFVSGSTLITLFLTQNLLLLLASYFLTQAIAATVMYYVYRPKEYHKETIPPEAKEQYLSYAKHTSVRNLIIGTAQRLDTVIIFQQLGAVPLALYSVATLVPDHVKGSFKNMQTLLIPKYTRHESLETIKHSIPKRTLQFFIFLIFLSVAFAVVVPFFYTLLFPNYTEAITLVQLLALSFPASIYLIPYGAMQAQQMERELYWFNILTSIAQIILLFVLTLTFGIIGAVWAKILSQYLQTIFSFSILFLKET